MLPRERTAAMCFSLSAAEISADPLAQEGTSIYCCRADDQSRTQARRGGERGEGGGREEERGGGEEERRVVAYVVWGGKVGVSVG